MSPMPPWEAGAFQITRTAFTRVPYVSARAASSVWTTALCPRPSNSTMRSARTMPSSRVRARSTASTGHSFSLVSGSFGPTSSTGTRIREVSGGTANPACSAIQCGVRPTTSGLSLASEQEAPCAVTPNTNSSSFAFSSGVATWACSRANSPSAAS